MKCELCHNNDARKAITLERDGKEEELYVCENCARRAGDGAQNEDGGQDGQNETTTVKLESGGIVSVTNISSSGEKPPPIVEAIIGAFDNALHMLGRKNAKKKPRERVFSTMDVPREFVLRDMFHLEAIFLSGQSQCAIRAAKALGLSLEPAVLGRSFECMRLFTLKYSGKPDAARSFASELVRVERGERARMVGDYPVLLADAAGRAIGIIKNCRLLSQQELVDLLCPLRLAASAGFIQGMTEAQIENMIDDADVSPYPQDVSDGEIDAIEADNAHGLAAAFRKVRLSDLAGKI